jgi:hypothetical protein
MKSVRRVLVNGLTGVTQGAAKRLGVCAVVAGLLLALCAPVSAKAESITQLETLQWLVQVCGDSGQFSSTSTTADLIQWARIKGMNPTGGWQPNAIVTRECLAQILVQLFGINPKKMGADYVRILEREGIIIQAGDVTRTSLIGVFDDYGFQSRQAVIARADLSPTKGNHGKGNGADPPPRGWTRPGHPHFNRPDENIGR